MTNKEKFLALVSKEQTTTLTKNKERIKNRAMLRESQQIAIKVLMKLDELGWNQKDLAVKLEVTPQQITKIVSGKENLTIETQVKLQNILDIPILASYYENKMNKINDWVVTIEQRIRIVIDKQKTLYDNYQGGKIINITSQSFHQESFQLAK